MKHYTFSEMHVGRKESIEVQVGEREIDAFAELSGDVSPIHIDDDFAKNRGLRSRIAHGALLVSYVSRLIGTMLPGANGLLQTIGMEFKRPCYAGTKIRIEGEIAKQVESVHVVRIKILVTDSLTGEVLAAGQVQSGVEDMSMGVQAMDAEEKYQFIKTRLQTRFPFFAGILTKGEQAMDARWREELVSDLERLFGDVRSREFDDALGGYVEFSIDAAKNQEFFLKRGRYKAQSFSEVKRDLLDNADHMLGNYLPGMFVSHYFWPHHYRMGSRYRNEIIPRVRTRSPRLFVEVGTGSAMYTLLTMSALPDVRGIGYDISPHSITFGRRVAKAFGFSDRFTFVEQDAFANPPEDKADYVVSQEVLEHLEDPLTFCKNLHRILKDDGYAYITAAVTAAHSDHIYLFKTPEELLSMLEGAGFRSVMYIEESSIDTRVPEKTPRICGHLLEKA